MNKQIIGLYGTQDRGKTSTLKLLISLLQPDSPTTVPEDSKDISIVIPYRGKRIAITTGGDRDKVVKKNIEFFEENNCDILITATKTSGKTREILESYNTQKTHLPIIWIKKNEEFTIELQHLTNQSQAKDIQALINSFISSEKK